MKRIVSMAVFPACLWAVTAALAAAPPGQKHEAGSATLTDQLLKVPDSHIEITPQDPNIKNPYAGDPHAVATGRKLFHSLNCVGCHAPEGGGGMGPPLSDNHWRFGGKPENIYMSIAQGRSKGMPAWGGALPPQAIWELVTYVKTLSKKSQPRQQPVHRQQAGKTKGK